MLRMLLMSLLFPVFLLSQTRINGAVVDYKTLAPLIGANLEIAGLHIGAVTDQDGFFELNIGKASPKDTLIVSYLGYEEKRIVISNLSDKSVISLRAKSLHLEEGVEVYGERIDPSMQDLPNMSEELNQDQIENYAIGDMKAIANKLPAVRVVGNGVDGSFFEIRGSNPNEVNVYVDGISINALDFNNKADLNMISTETIDNIKILKGGNLLLRGQGATGGVVYIDSKVPTEANVQVLSKIGDYDNKRYTGIINLPIGKNFALNYSGTYSQSRPELTFEINRFDPTRTDTYNILNKKMIHNFNAYYLNPFGRVSAKGIYYKSSSDKTDWRKNREVLLFGGTYLGKIWDSDQWQISVNQNYTNEIIDRRIPEQPDFSFNFDYHSDQRVIHFQKVFEFKSITFTGAYDYFHDELRRISSMLLDTEKTRFFANLTYDNQHSFTGVFNFLDTTATQKNLNWNVYTSMRYNWWASGQNDFVHNVGIKAQRQMNEKRWNVFFNFGKNVRYPTLLENAMVGDVLYFGIGQETDLIKLKPEYINAVESGLQYVVRYPYPYVPRLAIDVAIFWNSVENKVIRQPIDNILFFIQEGVNKSKGGEVSMKMDELADFINAGTSYNWINTSNKLLYSYKPVNSFKAWLEYARPLGFYITLLGFHDGESYAWYYDIDNNLITRDIAPFWDMDLVMGWKGRAKGLNYHLQFAVRNALDNSEYVDYYLKRRFYQISLSFKY